MVDAILNMGMPAPIDVQVSSPDLHQIYGIAQDLAGRIRQLPGVGEVYIPQDLNYPALRLDVDRVHAGELGLTQKEVVDNVITALNSNYMIAPNYWVDYKTGNDYYLTVQYYEKGRPAIHNFADLTNIPIRAPNLRQPTTLDSVVKLQNVQTPTEVDHYQIQRVTDVYVTPAGEDLGKVADAVRGVISQTKLPENVRVNLRGMVQGMQESFRSFAIGLSLSVVLLYLILVAQFKSFKDPFLIMLAIPMGFIGVLDHSSLDRNDAQRDVTDGSADAGRNLSLKQHSDCRIRPSAGRAGEVGGGGSDHFVPGAFAPDPDDVSGHHHRHGAHGLQTRDRQRTVRSAGTCHHRRPHRFRGSYCFYCAGRLFACVPQSGDGGDTVMRCMSSNMSDFASHGPGEN